MIQSAEHSQRWFSTSNINVCEREKTTSTGHLLNAGLCAQVAPDNAQFKDIKEEAPGSEVIPASSSSLETLHSKIFLVINFSDVENYTTSKPVVI